MYINRLVLLALLASAFTFSAIAESPQIERGQTGYWNLPQTLSSANSEIGFEIDSTWHLVKARVKEISGDVWLADPKDYRTVRAKIIIPVKSFDTDNGSRDEKMLRVMAESQYPQVEFLLTEVNSICDPQLIKAESPCTVELNGRLTIRGVEKQVNFPAQLSKTETGYQIRSEIQLDWSDYGVEDPSILIAKVEKIVEISILLKL